MVLPVLAQSASWFGPFTDDQRFVLVLVAMGCAAVVAITLGCTLFGVVRAVQRRSSEDALKRDLLDRGLSADEVAKIVEATTRPWWGA